MNGIPGAFDIRIIGERINPGFRSTQALFGDKDVAGIQALAVRQVRAGASCLNVNVGSRAMVDRSFLGEVIRAIQAVVAVPLSFDVPTSELFSLCLECYDLQRAGGELPVLNSITEHRWEPMRLYGEHRFRVMVMASESVVDGVARNNKTAADIAATARRTALRLRDAYAMPLEHVFVDLSVAAVIADTEGLNRATIEAVRLIGGDPELRGVHLMGGLSNIGQQLPEKAADGSNLKLQLENAFLTLTVPFGFDTVLGTPWRSYAPLPDDNYVLRTYRGFLEQTGSNALRAVRRFYRA